VSDSAADAVGAERAGSTPARAKGEKKPGVLARLALFVRQIIAELKKVVTPTRDDLVSYTIVVLVFVAVVMAFVTALDFGLGKLMFWLFAGN
jgi:preprotein translocase, SecE subunit, bacterial